MNNKIFLDTSVLVEALKGSKTQFYYSLVSQTNNILCINSTVLSEYLYHLTGFSGGSSPRSLQEARKLKQVLEKKLIKQKF